MYMLGLKLEYKYRMAQWCKHILYVKDGSMKLTINFFNYQLGNCKTRCYLFIDQRNDRSYYGLMYDFKVAWAAMVCIFLSVLD